MKLTLITVLLGALSVCAVSSFAQIYNFTTLAGKQGIKGSSDGSGSTARFNDLYAVVPDDQGNVYVADTYNYTIRKVTSKGVVTTIAGRPGVAGFTDGVGTGARFYFPAGMAIDATGAIYMTDASTIRKVTPDGVVTTFAGMLGVAAYQDGTGTNAGFSGLQGLAIDSAGNLYTADAGNRRTRKITTNAIVSTIGGPNDFIDPRGVAVDNAGNIYVADGAGCRIQKVTQDGVVSTFAGQTWAFGSRDGLGSAARFADPQGLAIDGAGNLYVAEGGVSLIRKITPVGMVTTIGGIGTGFADGVGSAALFHGPLGVAADKWGNIFIADTYNQLVRKGTPILPLQIYSAGSRLAVSWPSWAANYLLENRASIGDTNAWNAITNGITGDTNNFTYTFTPTNSAQFFRVRSP